MNEEDGLETTGSEAIRRRLALPDQQRLKTVSERITAYSKGRLYPKPSYTTLSNYLLQRFPTQQTLLSEHTIPINALQEPKLIERPTTVPSGDQDPAVTVALSLYGGKNLFLSELYLRSSCCWEEQTIHGRGSSETFHLPLDFQLNELFDTFHCKHFIRNKKAGRDESFLFCLDTFYHSESVPEQALSEDCVGFARRRCFELVEWLKVVHERQGDCVYLRQQEGSGLSTEEAVQRPAKASKIGRAHV